MGNFGNLIFSQQLLELARRKGTQVCSFTSSIDPYTLVRTFLCGENVKNDTKVFISQYTVLGSPLFLHVHFSLFCSNDTSLRL